MAFKGHEYVNVINQALMEEFGAGSIQDFGSPEWRDKAVSFLSEYHDLFKVSWAVIERNPALQTQLSNGLLLFEIGTHNGCPFLYGPFRLVDVGRRTLANPKGQVFTDYMVNDRFIAFVDPLKKIA